MTTRRAFIKTLAAAPLALAYRPVRAGGDPSRLALIIGNSRYRDMPLANPANDAKAMAGLLGRAGFSVDSRLDATRGEMMAAIEQFGRAVKRPDIKMVVFYYAGHGAQLDWRNYLLPVDAVVEKAEHMKQRCIDLGLLLEPFSAIKDKTFIVILDACRNNPFGAAYQPDQRGLSQFDAPVGSLLAYATAPGNVAADGSGDNGLYTSHLVRELARRGTRIEDALKRVRLNVRLDSRGEQIPWETTSLEEDVFIFSEDQKKLTESELETLVEADVTEWSRIKSSRDINDWVSYLRRFPNGRFAEIAQMRLNRLEQEKQPATPPAPVPAPGPAPAATPAAAPPRKPAIEIGNGHPVPLLMAPSANPYSAGRYPLNRKYSVGDSFTQRVSDILTGIEEEVRTNVVTRVDEDEDRVEYNNGDVITDLMGNVLKVGAFAYDTPAQFTPAELQVGRKWTASFRARRNGQVSTVYYDIQIVKREQVSVPAGRFDCFRIEGAGWNMTHGIRRELTLWMVPGLNFPVRSESFGRNRFGGVIESLRRELVAASQLASSNTPR